MEAIGEDAADGTAGRAVTPGVSAAALLGSRRLRSVPVSASGGHRSASDGGGFRCSAAVPGAVGIGGGLRARGAGRWPGSGRLRTSPTWPRRFRAGPSSCSCSAPPRSTGPAPPRSTPPALRAKPRAGPPAGATNRRRPYPAPNRVPMTAAEPAPPLTLGRVPPLKLPLGLIQPPRLPCPQPPQCRCRPRLSIRPMTGAGTPPSSCGSGSGSASARPDAAWPSPARSCRALVSPERPCPRPANPPPLRWPPGPSPPAPEPSSPPPWTRPAPSPSPPCWRKSRPSWSTPRSRTTTTS